MAIVAAGMEGAASAHDSGAPVDGDADARRDLARWPALLGDALAALERSTFTARKRVEEAVFHYAAHARTERPAVLGTVTDRAIVRGFHSL